MKLSSFYLQNQNYLCDTTTHCKFLPIKVFRISFYLFCILHRKYTPVFSWTERDKIQWKKVTPPKKKKKNQIIFGNFNYLVTWQLQKQLQQYAIDQVNNFWRKKLSHIEKNALALPKFWCNCYNTHKLLI